MRPPAPPITSFLQSKAAVQARDDAAGPGPSLVGEISRISGHVDQALARIPATAVPAGAHVGTVPHPRRRRRKRIRKPRRTAGEGDAEEAAPSGDTSLAPAPAPGTSLPASSSATAPHVSTAPAGPGLTPAPSPVTDCLPSSSSAVPSLVPISHVPAAPLWHVPAAQNESATPLSRIPVAPNESDDSPFLVSRVPAAPHGSASQSQHTAASSYWPPRLLPQRPAAAAEESDCQTIGAAGPAFADPPPREKDARVGQEEASKSAEELKAAAPQASNASAATVSRVPAAPHATGTPFSRIAAAHSCPSSISSRIPAADHATTYSPSTLSPHIAATPLPLIPAVPNATATHPFPLSRIPAVPHATASKAVHCPPCSMPPPRQLSQRAAASYPPPRPQRPADVPFSQFPAAPRMPPPRPSLLPPSTACPPRPMPPPPLRERAPTTSAPCPMPSPPQLPITSRLQGSSPSAPPAVVAAAALLRPPLCEMSQHPAGPAAEKSDCQIVRAVGAADADRARSVPPREREESKSAEELKRELERVSKQMNDLRNECAELKKGMKNKDLEIEAQEAEIQKFKKAKLDSSSKDIRSTRIDNDQSFYTPANEALLAEASCWTSTRRAEELNGKNKEQRDECAELRKGMKNKDLEIEAREGEIQNFKKAKVGCSRQDICSTTMDIDQSFHTPANEALEAGGCYWTSTRRAEKLNGIMKELHSSDYSWKISPKLLSTETAEQQAPGNAHVILNQNNPSQVSADSTAQTGRAGDWQEEIYQMIKSLKDQHFAALSELSNKISLRLQHVDSIMPRQMPSEKYERMRKFKKVLDRIVHFLQISKSIIQPSMRDKVPQYKKQIISILKAERRKQQFQQVQMNPHKGTSASGGLYLEENAHLVLKSNECTGIKAKGVQTDNKAALHFSIRDVATTAPVAAYIPGAPHAYAAFAAPLSRIPPLPQSLCKSRARRMPMPPLLSPHFRIPAAATPVATYCTFPSATTTSAPPRHYVPAAPHASSTFAAAPLPHPRR